MPLVALVAIAQRDLMRRNGDRSRSVFANRFTAASTGEIEPSLGC